MAEAYEEESMQDLSINVRALQVEPFMFEPMPQEYDNTNESSSSDPESEVEDTEADLVCRQCLTEGINFFRKWKKLSEFSDLFGIAILLSVHVSCVASLCVSLYTYGLHW